ncbi:hypothetical protein ACIQFP_10545 [Nocardiopsis alba]|uniref:hypothetical protein n=1 Tax=Nocardiopsis alba TaxID=53437 RepID=UPI00382DA00A
MHLWRAGEIITAEKLSPKILAGDVLMQFTERIPSDPSQPLRYWRGTWEVTFPDGFFTEPPMLSLSPRTTVPGVFLTVSYTAKSVNGFTLCAARETTTQTWIDWTAMQVPNY